MKFNYLLIYLCIVLSSFSFAKAAGETMFAPFDTNKTKEILPVQFLRSGNELIVLGECYRKQMNIENYLAPGIFSMRITPDNMFVYLYKQNTYKEYFDDGQNSRPLPIQKNSTIAWENNEGILSIVTSWNYYYEPGGFGSAGFPFPYKLNLNQEGNLIDRSVDTVTDRRNTPLWSIFPPIIKSENDKFITFTGAGPDSVFFVFINYYSETGMLEKRIILKSFNKYTSPIEDKLYYEPVKALKTIDGDYILISNITEYLSIIDKKYSASIMKINSNNEIIWEKIIKYDGDEIPGLPYPNISLMSIILDNDQNIVFFGRYPMPKASVTNNIKNYFAAKYSLDGNLITEKKWQDTVGSAFGSIIHSENGSYYCAGSEKNSYYSGNYNYENETNYALYRFSSDLEYNGMYANKDKKRFNDHFTTIIESSPGVFDCFGKYDRRMFCVRISDNDMQPLSVKEAEPNQIVIYPNPANDILNVKLNEKTNAYKIEVCDMFGRVTKSDNIFSSEISLNTSDLLSGMYIIKLYTTNDVLISRFIKQ